MADLSSIIALLAGLGQGVTGGLAERRRRKERDQDFLRRAQLVAANVGAPTNITDLTTQVPTTGAGNIQVRPQNLQELLSSIGKQREQQINVGQRQQEARTSADVTRANASSLNAQRLFQILRERQNAAANATAPLTPQQELNAKVALKEGIAIDPTTMTAEQLNQEIQKRHTQERNREEAIRAEKRRQQILDRGQKAVSTKPAQLIKSLANLRKAKIDQVEGSVIDILDQADAIADDIFDADQLTTEQAGMLFNQIVQALNAAGFNPVSTKDRKLIDKTQIGDILKQLQRRMFSNG